MMRIAISVEAFEAIARTLPLGSVAYEADPTERGERTVWLEEVWVDRLGAMRRPDESYSDVILRLVPPSVSGGIGRAEPRPSVVSQAQVGAKGIA
jgi:hypothetical protein